MSRGHDHEVGPRRSGPTLVPHVAAALFVIVAVAACAGDEGSPPLPPPNPPSPNEMSPEPAVGLRPLPWTHADVLGPRRLRLRATLEGGPPCAVLARVDVDETDDAVVVALWHGRRPDARCDGPQPAVALPISVTVELREPLGTRDLRDGSAHDDPPRP